MKFSLRLRNKIIKQVNKQSKGCKFCFGKTRLFLNKYTLVPHPDTFLLIDLARKLLKKNLWIQTVADIGTGSGVIAIKLGKAFPDKIFLASDISQGALSIAIKNALLNSAKNIQFFLNTDKIWLTEYKDKKIDFIISNPPFIGDKEYKSKSFLTSYPEVALEPPGAIRAYDPDGLGPFLTIIKNSLRNKTKLFLFQCNSSNLQNLTKKVTEKFPDCNTKVLRDNQDSKRFLIIKRKLRSKLS